MTKDERNLILDALVAKPTRLMPLRYLYGTVNMMATIAEQLDERTEPEYLAIFRVGGGVYHQGLATVRPDPTHIEGVLGGTFHISLN